MRRMISWWRSFLLAARPEVSDDLPINLELFNLEQLHRHAKALATRHELDNRAGRDSLLWRLNDNEYVLSNAYDKLSHAVVNKQQISPAGEWLLDNFHLIKEQISITRLHFPRGYSRELPHLNNTASAGLPRVYDLALEVIAHVDGRVDRENITNFVAAYQEIKQLKIGEFWAIPIMLRLALIENLRRVAYRVSVAVDERELARHWAKLMRTAAESDRHGLILVTADMARSNPPLSNAFVAEFVHNLQSQGRVYDIPLAWIEHQLEHGDNTIQQAVQQENQQQAANQVSVSASIGSMRFLSAMDWRSFVESLSSVEAALRRDPANSYAAMDFATRDSYRHAVERLAKQSGKAEVEIANGAIDLARESKDFNHVGYYLIDHGLIKLRDKIGQKSLIRSCRELADRWCLSFYMLAIASVTTLLAFIIMRHHSLQNLDTITFSVMAILTTICASQVAVAIINWLVTLTVKPRHLPRLDFSDGVPDTSATLVVIPTLLVNESDVNALLDGIEVRYLANRDRNIHFALLTDFTDASTETTPTDALILEIVTDGIVGLNRKYEDDQYGSFFLLHRSREWNAKDQVWMGRERKRGKLAALNALLMAGKNSSFSSTVGNLKLLSTIQYVITLDTDTQLPRESAHKLIGAMAHPLNQPIYDANKKRITSGYSILQPRVAMSLSGSQRSWFVRLLINDPGIDPYTNAVSDVYQDLFLEGSFIGKGIYHVEAFSKVLEARLPDNLILSHDLLEGCYARCGLITDVLLFEEHPHHFAEDVKRRQRWIRGDWQIIAWLLPRVPSAQNAWVANGISALSKWKIFDNIRRSLVSSAAFFLLIVAWLSLASPNLFTFAVMALIFLPLPLTSLAGALDKPKGVPLLQYQRGVVRTFLRHCVQTVIYIVFLPYDTLMSLNSIRRSLTRMLITGKGLLEWNAATDPRHTSSNALLNFYHSMLVVPVGASVIGAYLLAKNLTGFESEIAILGVWILSPAIAYWLSLPIPAAKSKLSSAQTVYLRRMARKTWRFFETFVGPEDHWLPPDNFQEYPVGIVAHRTSPTNMGLSLLANLSAYDFGYISGCKLLDRTSNAFATMEKLERFRGHFYNWYDTKTLLPLAPLYVSTVDSGNLSGLLYTLKQGLQQLPASPIIAPQIFSGLADTLAVIATYQNATLRIDQMRTQLAQPLKSTLEIKDLLTKLDEVYHGLRQEFQHSANEEARWWIEAFNRQMRDELCQNLLSYLLWIDFMTPEIAAQCPQLTEIPTYHDIASLSQSLLPIIEANIVTSPDHRSRLEELREAVNHASECATEFLQKVDKCIQQCDEFAAVEYEFLYDRSRHLLSIGYSVSDHRRDASFYDLLASEARLCSFIGIAQGLLPQEHWFALGRLLTTWRGESTLLSWSGSMFEYLMPLLVMPTFPNTLLDQAYRSSVRRQIAYGKKCGIPWGISESGYNLTDVNLNYQYRAFGVPGLGFKRGLTDDLVLAPYASVMAMMVFPEEACRNMQRMSALGYEGKYGFYEAVDFTAQRLNAGQTSSIVKSFMAHHQGMSFLSLAFHLLNQKMQQRFHSDPLFQSTELLLHERIPRAAMYFPHEPEVLGAARLSENFQTPLRVIKTPFTPRPEVHLLSNGRYSVMITNSGGGYSRWQDFAVTRWREDPTRDAWGNFCYLRDTESNDVWSAAYQPTLTTSDQYEAIFTQARAEFRRRDHDLDLHTEITVSSEDDIELHRFSLTNLSGRTRTIEFTSYAEVVLAPQASDEAHPAFSNLFVQTEIVPQKQAIICTRRPRSQNEKTPTMIHLMSAHGVTDGHTTYETDRSKFIGRGRSTNSPIALDRTDLTGTQGSVLDPIVAIRCCITIEPEQTVKIHLVTGVSETRDQAISLLDKYHDRHLADRVFELAWTHRQVVLRQLSITETEAQLYGRMASSVIYCNPSRRASPSLLMKNSRGQSSLWGYGISGDLPIILLKISSREKLSLLKQLLHAHNYWRLMGLICEVVVLIEDDSSYRQDLFNEIMGMIAAVSHVHLVDKLGGYYVRRSEQMSQDDQILLHTVARAIVSENAGTLMEQWERRTRSIIPVPLLTSSRERTEFIPTQVKGDKSYTNHIGDFSPDGKEYHILTSRDQLTPAPWSNVIANRYFGTIVSESGAGYTWCENAHEFRLTPWNNDPVGDSSGEAFYLRDEETGYFWSPTPLPVRSNNPYLTKHGFGYSVFAHENEGVESQTTIFVAIDAPVKLSLFRLKNKSSQARTLSLTGYCEWILGEMRSKALMHVVTEVDPASGALFARNRYHAEFAERVGFFSVNDKLRSVTGDRTEFLGRNGHMSDPEALHRLKLSGKVGAGLDPCAGMQISIKLEPGEERDMVFLLGVGRGAEDARTLIRRFGDVTLAENALKDVKSYWQRIVGAVQISTPDPSINQLGNGWLIYQVIASRLWARSGFYQSSGAFGFRDQLQDTMALVHADPRFLREQLLRCAAQQFRDGDVQHWWHPPSGRGVRTHFSDDFLWLPLATSRFVLTTGDTGILDEAVNFIEGRPIKPDEEAYMDLPHRTEDSATLYEHCVRAIKNGMRIGSHGLPLMGCGDWNDGMNLVGAHGRGESVWLAFFTIEVLQQFEKIAKARGDEFFATLCSKHAAMLKNNIEKNSWDGKWYRRAYFDNGEPLGSTENSECQIDSLPQSWAILSRAGDPVRSAQAMESLDSRLIDRKNGLIKLFDPPFDTSDLNPGYIKGYVPGVRENGGQYTHAGIWAAMAFAALGDQKRAWEYLAILNPLNHARTDAEVATYKVEPYVMAADVYAVAPHTGRGGWTWYTGAAGWMYRLILESLLGIRLEVDVLYFTPCVPAEWPGFTVKYQFRATTYHLQFFPATAVHVKGVASIDGVKLVDIPVLLLKDDQIEHQVEIRY